MKVCPVFVDHLWLLQDFLIKGAFRQELPL
jgi:hypothetical protein